MIETKSQASHVYALSQYVCEQSLLDNDETESEHDEDELEAI